MKTLILNHDQNKYKKRFFIKQFLDILLSILILPVFFLTTFCVLVFQLRSVGVFFKQPRIGMNGKIFNIYKFKTMIDSNNEMKLDKNGIVRKNNDSRITKFGNILRNYGIDEIPQIINIVKGEMSWIGPRPIVKIEFDNLTEIEKTRIRVKPGVTGLAQINGRDTLDIKTLTKYDLEYIDKYSFMLDLIILLKSLKVVIAKEKHYCYKMTTAGNKTKD